MDIQGDYSSRSFQAVNPANGEKLPNHYAFASDEDVNLACQLADQASLKLAVLSGQEKANFLRTLADGIEGIVDDLVGVMTQETGLPEFRVRGETGRTCGQLRMFAQLVEDGNWVDARIDCAQPDRKPLPKPDLRSCYDLLDLLPYFVQAISLGFFGSRWRFCFCLGCWMSGDYKSSSCSSRYGRY